MRNRDFLTVAFILFVISIMQVSQVLSTEPSPQAVALSVLKFEVGEAIPVILNHTIEIINSASQSVHGGDLFIPIIRNQTARHNVFLVSASSTTRQPEIMFDDSGNIYAHWTDISIGRQQRFKAELRYLMLSYDLRYVLKPELIGDYNVSSDLFKKYTQPENLVESDDSRITAKAENLTSEEEDVESKVWRIYRFVVSHVHYVTQEHERGALWALVNGTGDCTEYSSLFVALCRAAGIPARIQAGFAFHPTNQTTESGHMWAEYYLENYDWIPIDPTWQQFSRLDSRHFSQIQSMSSPFPYASFYFNYTSGPSTDLLKDSQMITIEVSNLSNSSLGAIEEAVQKINQAKLPVLFAGLVGSLAFSSTAEEMKSAFNEGQLELQAAIESWEINQGSAETHAVSAKTKSKIALQRAWQIVTYTITISIVILMAATVVTWVSIRKSQI